MALVRASGVSAKAFLPYAVDNFNAMSSYLADAATNLDAGSHPGDLASVIMMGATARHIVEASTEAGIEVGLPSAVSAHYERAIAMGHGNASWTSLFEGIKRPTT
jgi:hypothetical protein